MYIYYSIISVIILPKNALPESNYMEKSDQFKLRSSLQKGWSIVFKGVKVIRVKGRWRDTVPD